MRKPVLLIIFTLIMSLQTAIRAEPHARLNAPTHLDHKIGSTVPVQPYLVWLGSPEADQYRVYVMDDNGTVFDHFFPATICNDDSICEIGRGDTVLVEPWGLLSGNYQWWVGAMNSTTGETAWSGGVDHAPATFSVTLSVPAKPTLYAVWHQFEPYIYVDLAPDTYWFQLYIGGHGQQYLQWHSIEDPACDGMIGGECHFQYDFHLPLYWGPGEYEAWVQAWGLGGFSSPDGTNSVDSWAKNGNEMGLVFPDTAPVAPGIITNNIDDDDIILFWSAMDNATWHEVSLMSTAKGVVYQDWHHSGTLLCYTSLCELTVPDMPDGTYTARIRSWGPGGFSTGGPNNDGYAVFQFEHID